MALAPNRASAQNKREVLGDCVWKKPVYVLGLEVPERQVIYYADDSKNPSAQSTNMRFPIGLSLGQKFRAVVSLMITTLG